MPPDFAARLEEIAEKVARDLFTDGIGGEACRLVMEYPQGPKFNSPGWSEAAVRDRVLDALNAALDPTPRERKGA